MRLKAVRSTVAAFACVEAAFNFIANSITLAVTKQGGGTAI
jgi:hypothetical protein